MLEKCLQCGGSVLYVNDFCPNCRRSRVDGSSAPDAPKKPSVSPKSSRSVLFVACLLYIAAAFNFWYGQFYLKTRPGSTLAGHKIRRLTLEQDVALLKSLTTPGKDGLAHYSLLPELKEAQVAYDQAKRIRLGIWVFGAIMFLCGTKVLFTGWIVPRQLRLARSKTVPAKRAEPEQPASPTASNSDPNTNSDAPESTLKSDLAAEWSHVREKCPHCGELVPYSATICPKCRKEKIGLHPSDPTRTS